MAIINQPWILNKSKKKKISANQEMEIFKKKYLKKYVDSASPIQAKKMLHKLEEIIEQELANR